ncbi:YraN family protein [Candidatus Parcubacteria bacterium]|jgi:putative endonuclease|nr:MAG: YraN family protein [Candidatus Parcubacteria bacterium]
MRTIRKNIGDRGELFAQNFLKQNGWKILKTNIRLPWNDEIDILARDPEGVLVFVEVKTVTGNFLNPEEQMTREKIKKCIRAATWYANQFPEIICEQCGWRIDCVALKENNGNFLIHHHKQIVS